MIMGLLIAMLQPLTAGDNQDTFFSNLTTRDGLPSNIIASITQDKYDFIWIGTGSGLARYDGYQFQVFKKTESPNSIPSNEMSTLLADGEYIWVGTWNGLCRIHAKTFKIDRIDLGQAKAIRALHKGKDSVLWIGTGSGLIRYDLRHKKYSLYNSRTNNLSHNTIRAIHEDVQGNLWVGTYDGLNQLKPGSADFERVSLRQSVNSGPKNHLILDIKPGRKSNDLWIGTETGLYLLDTETKISKHFNGEQSKFSNEVVKCIYQSDEGNLWLGTDFGLNIFNPTWEANKVHFHNPQLPYSIANNVIWQIFEDRSGVIWLVTSNGLSKINKAGSYYDYEEVSYKVENQLIGNQVKTILSGSDGHYWLGTEHGVVKVNPATGGKEIINTASSDQKRLLFNNVFALEEDQHGHIWIGTAGGINIWDGKQMHAVAANTINGLTSNYIAKFVKGPEGNMWVSAWEGGVFKITGALENLKFTQVPHLEGSEKFASGGGYLWAIAFDELYRIDPKTLKRTHIPSFSKVSGKQMIYSLYFSDVGDLWAGTLNGLVQYRPKEQKSNFIPLKTGNDMIINSIIEDRHGNIWSTSSRSLQKFSPLNQSVEIYPLDQGLPLKSFYYGCADKTRAGEILFGGDNGYITLYPDKAQPNRFNPSVYITAIAVNNKKIAVNEKVDGEVFLKNDIAFIDELTLDYAQRSVTFEFSSLHFWQPQMNVYAYRLEGLEKGWKYVSGTKNFAVYSSLPAGSYNFQVKATNNYGVESDHIANIALTIRPPLYLSPAFITIYVVLVIALVFYLLRFYSARVHLKNELKITKMEKAHAEEIEQTKELFFTNISHELRTPISLILPPIHELLKKGKLDEHNHRLVSLAEKNSVRLLRLVNQILDFNKMESEILEIKAVPVDIIAFCREVFELFTDQASRHQMSFTFSAFTEHCPAWVDTEKIETVLFNLLSNAFKFTPEKGAIALTIEQVEATGSFKEGLIQIEVRDTGIGISPFDRDHIFERFYQTSSGKRHHASSGIGLTLAAEYVALHQGTIKVDSLVGEGTTFTIQLPLGKAHLPVGSVREESNTTKVKASRSLYAHQKMTNPNHSELNSDNPLILIVEDNDDIIEFIRTSLGNQYNFIMAANGAEGLAKADHFIPELIISDIMMPVMDGMELCEKLKVNPKTSHVMVILLTAKSMDANRLEGIRKGADVYLTKPFEIDLLDAHIRNLLQRKQELTNFFRKELMTSSSSPKGKDNQDNKFVKKVMDIIAANVDEPEFGVEQISKELGMSATHLYRRLKSLTNHSAQDIIRKYRLKKASLFLKNNEGNVSETMYKVGFSSLSYFSKCFKAEYGLTPKEYQNEHRDKEVLTGKDIGKS